MAMARPKFAQRTAVAKVAVWETVIVIMCPSHAGVSSFVDGGSGNGCGAGLLVRSKTL